MSAPGAAGRLKPTVVFAGLGIGLFGAVLAALAMGAVDVAPSAVVGILLDRFGLDTGIDYTATQDAVLWSIRLPRVLLGAFVGAGLGVAGAALQGAFRNPLADPQLIGISSGAALGAVLFVLAFEGIVGGLAAPLGGVVGALGASLIVYALARHEGRTEVVTLVLAGFAVAAIAGAAAALVSVAADDPRLGSALFYSLGTLSVATWRALWWTLPFVLAAMVAIPLAGRQLDLVLLGEREAAHLGVPVARLRLVVVVLSALAVGAGVAAAGVIGFVGLLVPHALRLVIGPGHRYLLPASAVGGAAFVVAVDLIARTIASPLEVPIGLLTALVGGPVFLAVLSRTRREHGGWG